MSRPRQAINRFVARHELAWDLSMAVLALLYITAGLFEDHPHGLLTAATVTPLETAITVLFASEFALRFYAAESRRTYIKRHWIDLLALLPAVRFLRFLRLGRLFYLLQAARVLRLGVLVRFLVESDRIGNQIRWVAARRGVHVLLLSALGLVMVGGSLVWELEHATNASFHNWGDAVWWAFATMTTVGYGNGPQTVPGRAIAALIMVIGIACFGLITATVTAYFLRSDKQEVSNKDLLSALSELQSRFARLEEAIYDPTSTSAGDRR